tara:strand:- start:563 stop:835 length:273 start_codon:yes stop_codon:yes gene_type:complete
MYEEAKYPSETETNDAIPNGKPKISTSLFVELTMDIADWLMSANLGAEKYKSFLVKEDGVESFNEEGQDIFNGWNEDVEQSLHTYFEREE